MKIGALWLKEKEDGTKYFSGEIDLITSKVNIVVFKNDNKKEGSNMPDYEIIKSRPRKEEAGGNDEQINSEDVPF